MSPATHYEIRRRNDTKLSQEHSCECGTPFVAFRKTNMD